MSNVIGEFETKAGTLRATLSEYRGRLWADVRLWIEPREAPGAELVPTRKGVSVPAEYAEDLAELTTALAEAVRQHGRPRRGRA